MAQIIDLRRRIRAVKDTQKTTKAMKTVSAAKLRRSVGELTRTRPIMEKIEYLLRRVGSASNIAQAVDAHPILQTRESGRTIIVALGGDKGLCGAFNSHLISLVETKKAEMGDFPLVTVGNKIYKHFVKRDYTITQNYPSVMSKLNYRHALELSEYLQKLYLDPEEDVKAIDLVYTEFVSAGRQERAVKRLFPISFDWETESAEGDESEGVGPDSETDIEYIFEPSAEVIFKALLPRYINTTVYQSMLQSAASEHAARMVAMDLATNNASDMIKDLTLTMNKLRQASITKELLEIITATEALNK